MLHRIVKSVVRQFFRRPAFSILNLTGLAAGIAAGVLIFLYAFQEMNVDAWVPDQDHLYRVEGRFVQAPSGGWVTFTPTPLKAELATQVSEVELAARLLYRTQPVKRGQQVNYEQVAIVDPDFLKLFPLMLVGGRPASLAGNPNDILISETMAAKYFGTDNAVGQTLTLDGNLDVTVAGVIRDLPAGSDFSLDLVMALRDELVFRPDSWNVLTLRTYVRLASGAEAREVNQKLTTIVESRRPFFGNTPDEMRSLFRLFLQPFGDIHLGSTGRSGANASGNYATIYGFIIIAALVLGISAFNYMSLATARSLEREREICLHKVAGARRHQIACMAIGESVIQTVLAAVLGLMVAIEVLPFFNTLLDQRLLASDLWQPGVLSLFFAAALSLGVLAGLYPAVIVAGFRPARVLSGGHSDRLGLSRFQTGIVFMQFAVAIGLIVGTVTIFRQVDLINTTDLGFNRDGLVVIRGVNRQDTAAGAEAFRERVGTLAGVQSTTFSEIVPMDSSTSMEEFFSHNVAPEEAPAIRVIGIDWDFFQIYGSTLVAGRLPNPLLASDETRIYPNIETGDAARAGNVFLNETAVRGLGFAEPQKAVGEQIFLTVANGISLAFTVAGVVRDVHFRSVKAGPQAVVFYRDGSRLENLTVRLQSGMEQEVLPVIAVIWAEMFPETPLRYDFLEERVDNLYRTEKRQLRLFGIFSGLAIALSLFGLAGLVLNSIARRNREISIRKILGARQLDVIRLFTWQYMRPVLIAAIPGSAAAYWFLADWLEQYAVRVELEPALFLTAGGSLLLLTLSLVAAIVIRTARKPPALALRYE